MAIIVEDITFKSKHQSLKGRTYRPAKEGRHPAVAICHGYPGDTKNMDLDSLIKDGVDKMFGTHPVDPEPDQPTPIELVFKKGEIALTITEM